MSDEVLEDHNGKQIGRPVRRLEDRRFLVGRGRYVDDIVLPRQLYAAFVRSPHAHARIRAVRTEEALRAPGVATVWTSEQLAGVPDLKPNWIFPGSKVRGRPPLAREWVRHVGEGVAVVVADSLSAAVDAAELVEVEYEVLPAIVDQVAAAAEGAGRIHPDIPRNIATVFAAGTGDFDKCAEGADLRLTMKLRNQRLVPFPLEPRAVNADYDPATGKLTFYCCNQIPHMLRRMLAAAIDFPEQKLRVISPDVGGGFGPKMHLYPEEVVLARLSQKLERPVKWTETRRENVVSTTHGRDHVMTAEVAARADGKILALRVRSLANVGAYLSSMGTGVPTVNVGLFLLGVYAIPSSEVLIQCVYTHTTPVDAYRGAGRPEAAYLIERVVERVAQELSLDPAEVRRRNFVSPEQMPYRQPTGTTLDSGDYASTLNLALEKVGYEALREEQRRARAGGRLIGIGISNYTETCGMGNAAVLGFVGFDRGGFESAIVRVQPDGRATVLSGSHSHGQGHVTTFAQIAADELGIPLEDIEVIQGDTDVVPFGIGTFNSRSIPVGGSAVKLAAGRVAEKMRRIAAHLLQCPVEDLLQNDGLFRTRQGNGSVSLREVGRAAWTGQGLPPGMGIGLEETEFYHPQGMSSPFGSHVAVVEVDTETGDVHLRRYLAVDDCGVIINPLLARGQVHGGVAQGIGQALWEGAAYDGEGRPDPDPPIPRFDMLPAIETDHTVSPTPTNPLGAKGLGEAGTVGAPPAIVNAVIDALWRLGVRELDMPLTPERVLSSIEAALRERAA
ncbi:MAG: xanthine dehydrogenase family protein molybdopterin-binding subunit [Phenylobacterium sp.]|uniref:xanthine dehydrogenase family protein molybdopterin-binding subunit n=1 Tax=Phenylobacterium sp. TaxID=1871053 RepID=UPI003919D3A3